MHRTTPIWHKTLPKCQHNSRYYHLGICKKITIININFSKKKIYHAGLIAKYAIEGFVHISVTTAPALGAVFFYIIMQVFFNFFHYY